MSTNIPNTLPELIDWAITHKALWTTNQAQIGLSAAQVTAFTTLVTNLTKANDDAEAARQASKNATLTLNGAATSIRGVGGAYVNLIKAFAQTTHNDAVYTLAGVSPDSPAGTVPPPNAPTDFSAQVTPEGALIIKWKATQPASGVQYRVKRRLNGEGEFSLIDTVGSIKKYMDKTLPFGVDRVDYIVEPVRGNDVGPAGNTFSLQFGMQGGGFAITSAMESGSAPARLAA